MNLINQIKNIMGVCFSKKKKTLKIEREPYNEAEYVPNPDLVLHMKKENVVRMINGDMENKFQSVVQILIEIDDLSYYILNSKLTKRS